ncbi:hypothetical protein CA13_05050 [Planctomycetes bacterium CA13]|uniref:Uncharacterized protein n=1 Tax=Novipirellula herctigrandis TaxID=2527986 RepID=A0A5C5YVQ7_9BACT|nr:hypothetical protein CA13_05050 [Planctomycetes bacterium CA13]
MPHKSDAFVSVFILLRWRFVQVWLCRCSAFVICVASETLGSTDLASRKDSQSGRVAGQSVEVWAREVWAREVWAREVWAVEVWAVEAIGNRL